MIALHPRVEIVLKAQGLFHFLHPQPVAVQLTQVQDHRMVDPVTLHPGEFVLQKEAGIGNGPPPVFLQHEFPILIDPENLLFPHEWRDLLGIGQKVRVAIDAKLFHVKLISWNID